MNPPIGKPWLLAAGVSTLAGTALLYLYTERFERQLTGGAMYEVVTLAQDVAVGDTLSAAMLSPAPLPARYLESRHILYSDQDQLVGLQVSLAGRAGERLLWTDLAGMTSEGRTLAEAVPEGMRALAISASHDGIAHLLRPGDMVDVLLVSAGPGEVAAAPLLQDVLVLAVDGRLSRRSGGDGSGNGEVTLSVTPAQSQALASAVHRGRLELTLRNPSDSVILNTSQDRVQAAALPR